ncbi:MAG: hypothetical protein ACHBN1_24615 [Heteroscytonema crispum UTEX LB 1556]
MNILRQYILQQAEAHQQLLHECDIQLHDGTLTIVCHKYSDVIALKEAIPLLTEGLEAIAERIVLWSGQCMIYRCSIKVALEKYALRLAALREQLGQVGIEPR